MYIYICIYTYVYIHIYVCMNTHRSNHFVRADWSLPLYMISIWYTSCNGMLHMHMMRVHASYGRASNRFVNSHTSANMPAHGQPVASIRSRAAVEPSIETRMAVKNSMKVCLKSWESATSTWGRQSSPHMEWRVDGFGVFCMHLKCVPSGCLFDQWCASYLYVSAQLLMPAAGRQRQWGQMGEYIALNAVGPLSCGSNYTMPGSRWEGCSYPL